MQFTLEALVIKNLILLPLCFFIFTSCRGPANYQKFFEVANEQMKAGYQWHYVGIKDATKENIEFIPIETGTNGEKYIHFQLRKP